MEQIIVPITQAHIAAGIPDSAHNGALSQSLLDAEDLADDLVETQPERIRVFSQPNTGAEQFHDYCPAPCVVTWFQAFDAEEPVTPTQVALCPGYWEDVGWTESHAFIAAPDQDGQCPQHEHMAGYFDDRDE